LIKQFLIHAWCGIARYLGIVSNLKDELANHKDAMDQLQVDNPNLYNQIKELSMEDQKKSLSYHIGSGIARAERVTRSLCSWLRHKPSEMKEEILTGYGNQKQRSNNE